jgi:hypothetical protein
MREAATNAGGIFLWVEFLLFFNPFHHNTVNISIIYTNLIALFVAAIYNIYNIYSAKDSFNGLYDSKRSSGKMGNHSTPGSGALRTGQNTGRCSVWGDLGNTKECGEA